MEKLKEIKYDKFQIFHGSKMHEITVEPEMYGRKHIREMGKTFIRICKELTDQDK